MNAKKNISGIDLKSQRITRNSEFHTLRDEITIDFDQLKLTEYGSLCLANIQFKKVPIINLNLPDETPVEINMELPEGIKFKGNSMNFCDGYNFKKITEICVGDIIKTKGDYYVTDIITYGVLKEKVGTNNIGYLYLEYKPRGDNPKKIDPKELDLKIACEYVSNIYKKNRSPGCSIL